MTRQEEKNEQNHEQFDVGERAPTSPATLKSRHKTLLSQNGRTAGLCAGAGGDRWLWMNRMMARFHCGQYDPWHDRCRARLGVTPPRATTRNSGVGDRRRRPWELSRALTLVASEIFNSLSVKTGPMRWAAPAGRVKGPFDLSPQPLYKTDRPVGCRRASRVPLPSRSLW